MAIIRIAIPLVPQGKMRHRSRIVKGYNAHGNHPEPYIQTYSNPKQKAHLFYLRRYLQRAWGKDPSFNPFKIGLVCFMPIPQSKPIWWKELALKGLIQPTTKPDLSNIIKLVEDVANGVIWKDDSQIVGFLQMDKFYSLTPKYVLSIKELPSEDDLRNQVAAKQLTLETIGAETLTPLWKNSKATTERITATIQS
jgi:Holliday junction resolvase RusA-like endonuclease